MQQKLRCPVSLSKIMKYESPTDSLYRGCPADIKSPISDYPLLIVNGGRPNKI